MGPAGEGPAGEGTLPERAAVGEPRLAGLVLAAGAGRRLGQPKAGVELGGRRLVDRQVDLLSQAACSPVVAVVGAVELRVPGAITVANREWRCGMSSSLAAGLTRLAPLTDVDAVAVVLVDQPGLSPEAVRRTAAPVLGGASAARAAYHGRPGHPVVLARAVWQEVLATLHGDAGARRWLQTHAAQVVAVDCAEVATDDDIDSASDLSAARSRLHRL